MKLIGQKLKKKQNNQKNTYRNTWNRRSFAKESIFWILRDSGGSKKFAGDKDANLASQERDKKNWPKPVGRGSVLLQQCHTLITHWQMNRFIPNHQNGNWIDVIKFGDGDLFFAVLWYKRLQPNSGNHLEAPLGTNFVRCCSFIPFGW